MVKETQEGGCLHDLAEFCCPKPEELLNGMYLFIYLFVCLNRAMQERFWDCIHNHFQRLERKEQRQTVEILRKSFLIKTLSDTENS